MRDILTQVFTDAEISFYKDKADKREEIEEDCWKMDIDPKVYYERSTDEIARDRINFQEKIEKLNRLFSLYDGIQDMELLKDDINSQIMESNKYEDWVRKEVLKRYKKYLLKRLEN